MTIDNRHLDDPMQPVDRTALINTPTCYQSYNLTCIDYILTNHKSLKNTKLQKTHNTYSGLEGAFENILNKHKPIKRNILKHKNNSFMTKDLRYEIVKRSKLKNSFNKNRYHVNWYTYKSQRDYCVNLSGKQNQTFQK